MYNKSFKVENLGEGRTATALFNLSGLSKKELLNLWYETDKRLQETNPFENYFEWRALQEFFKAIVQAYYADFDGFIKLEEGQDNE